MPNNLYQQLNQNQTQAQPITNKVNPQALQSVKQMMSLFKNGANPQGIMSMLMQQNPQIRQIMQMVNSSGMSPKELFMQQAKQAGVDPNEVINMLK